MKTVSESIRKGLHSDESGYILVMSLFVLVVLFLIGTALTIIGIQEFTLSARTKLMDQAYAIADAGINRAAVAIQMDSGLAQSTSPGPYPTAQSGPYTENFGGGTFTWTIYQSETMPANPTYKVVRAKGSITRGGKTAERTLETRIVVGAGGDQYDASFDYLFYVGNKDNPTTPADWPDQRWFGGTLAGNYTWDGATPYNGRYPRGAAYVRGGIKIPVLLLGDFHIAGNIVATDDITLQNTWNAGWNDTGLVVDQNGKCIAGLDGSGSVQVNLWACTQVMKPNMLIDGQLIASDNVTITATANAAFTDAVLRVDGIKAGQFVTCDGTANILSKGIRLGDDGVVAGKKVTINSSWGNGVTAQNIWTGSDPADNKGLVLNTSWVSSITASAVQSKGRVDCNATLSSITLSGITAGNDVAGNGLGGTGVYFNMGFGGGSTCGNIVSTGKVDLNASVLGSMSLASITAGTDAANGGAGGTGIYIHGAALSSINMNGGALTAQGNITLAPGIGNSVSAGAVWTGGNFTCNTQAIVFGGSQSYGTMQAVGNIYVDCGWGLPWSDAGSFNSSTVWAQGSIYLHACGHFNSGSIYGNSDISTYNTSSGGYIRIWGEIKGRGNIYTENCAYPGAGSSWYSSGGEGSWNAPGGLWGETVTVQRDDFADISDTDVYRIGHLSGAGSDSIRANNWVRLKGCGDIWPFTPDIYCDQVRVHSWASVNVSGSVDWGRVNDDNVGLPDPITVNAPGNPAKPNPVSLDRDGDADAHGATKHIDVLQEANLTSTVNLLAPNWDYFETMAQQDDTKAGPSTTWRICPTCGERNTATASVCANPTCSANISAVPTTPGGAHMIYDGGPGDSDGAVNGSIQFIWDTSKAYSSNETIYNGDPNVALQIRALNWSNHGAAYEGTIVSRGDVTITAPNTDWFMNSSNTINLVSGHDITTTTAGLTLWETTNCNYHFWADHDIIMTNMRFSLGGNQTYFGSMTAGNRITLADNSFWPNTTYRWSRWALDPVAWAPPFQVLTWKEI
jgi:hypothetical protein